MPTGRASRTPQQGTMVTGTPLSSGARKAGGCGEEPRQFVDRVGAAGKTSGCPSSHHGPPPTGGGTYRKLNLDVVTPAAITAA